MSENNNTHSDIAVLEIKVEQISTRLTKLEDIITKLYALDKSIDKMESRVGAVEEKLKSYEVQVLELRNSVNTNFGSMQSYFKDTIEKKLDHISTSTVLSTTSSTKPNEETHKKLVDFLGTLGKIILVAVVIIAGILGIPVK